MEMSGECGHIYSSALFLSAQSPLPHCLGSWRLGLGNHQGLLLDFLEDTLLLGLRGPLPTAYPLVGKDGT